MIKKEKLGHDHRKHFARVIMSTDKGSVLKRQQIVADRSRSLGEEDQFLSLLVDGFTGLFNTSPCCLGVGTVHKDAAIGPDGDAYGWNIQDLLLGNNCSRSQVMPYVAQYDQVQEALVVNQHNTTALA